MFILIWPLPCGHFTCADGTFPPYWHPQAAVSFFNQASLGFLPGSNAALNVVIQSSLLSRARRMFHVMSADSTYTSLQAHFWTCYINQDVWSISLFFTGFLCKTCSSSYCSWDINQTNGFIMRRQLCSVELSNEIRGFIDFHLFNML